MTTSLVLLGGGGHAVVVAEALRTMGLALEGVVAREPPAGLLAGLPYLGDDAVLLVRPGPRPRLANGIGGTAPGGPRRAVFETLRAAGYDVITVIHAAAIVTAGVVLGPGAQVMAGAVIQPGARLGANALVNTGACVDHGCVLGDHVHVAPRAVLSGDVTVGAGSHVGTGATVIQGIRIGAGCRIAAGAVVVRDVPDGATVMGVPARLCAEKRR